MVTITLLLIANYFLSVNGVVSGLLFCLTRSVNDGEKRGTMMVAFFWNWPGGAKNGGMNTQKRKALSHHLYTFYSYMRKPYTIEKQNKTN